MRPRIEDRPMNRFLLLTAALSLASPATAAPVNTDNFARAESDLYFAGLVARGQLGKLTHDRTLADVANQTVIRLNRDTLYSSGVFDLDAGPVTITVPDPGARFLSVQIIDEDHYTHGVHYGAGEIELTRDDIGTRYVLVGIRTLANPADTADMAQVHALQDAVTVEQPGGPGSFAIPDWDKATQDLSRKALLDLAALLPDTRGMFGARDQVDPVRHVIGSASAWGGNPETEAMYLNRTAPQNDGQAVYRVRVADVPVEGFWSISVYNAQGYYTPNDLNAYTVNNLTATPAADGSVTVQFGGCDGAAPNCLPTPADWNWMVRLYRPEAAVLDGSWVFPELAAVN
jgi:hypothetical protein